MIPASYEISEGTDRRQGQRRPMLVNARCLLDTQHSSEVWLLDISATGCQLFAGAGLLRGAQEIVIQSQGEACYRGQIAWVSGMRAGLRFDLALPPVALDQLLAARPSLSLEPVRSFEVLTDRWGRELAPLPVLLRSRAFG